jgi:hypothetical protein
VEVIDLNETDVSRSVPLFIREAVLGEIEKSFILSALYFLLFIKVKIKLSLCLTEHSDIKAYLGVEV